MSCLLPRLALGRHDSVHAEIFNDLPVMIVAVADHLHREIQTRHFPVAAEWTRHLFGRILSSNGIDGAVRFGEGAFQIVDYLLLGLDVLWSILAGARWRLLTHDSCTVCL